MSTLQKIIKWIYCHKMELGRKPKVIPITRPEMMDIMSDYSPHTINSDYANNGKNQIHGIDTEESPWAEMTRHRILEIGVERLSMENKIHKSRFRASEYTNEYSNYLVIQLTAEILTDVTHLDVSFDWDRLAWLKRRVKLVGRRWPVKRKAVRIKGKVLYPYLKIQAPADTHKVKFLCSAMTRQRRWQLKHKELGLCHLCQEPSISGVRCLKHAVKQRELNRIKAGSKRRNNSLTYRLEKGVA